MLVYGGGTCYNQNMNALRLTHEVLRAKVKADDVVIDATAGRGYDTSFLCELSNNVTAFDIQQEAIDSAAALLRSRGQSARLILDSHENMAQYFDEESVSAIVFNLGYLPKGDHRIFTQFKSTRKAIESGLKLLKSGGLMCVCVYYGGDSGYEERDALLPYLMSLDDQKYQVTAASFLNWTNDPPIPVFIEKL